MLRPARPPTNRRNVFLRLLSAAVLGANTAAPPDTTSNHLISEYAKLGRIADAREMFDQMPERKTVSSNTPGILAAPPATSAYNQLITDYAKLGRISDAREVFDKMPERNTVSYNAMIAAYARSGQLQQSSALLSEMMLSGLRPTESTVAGILAAPPAGLPCSRRLHPLILKTGLLQGSAFVATSLLGALGRSGEMAAAMEIFRDMGARRTAITYNSIITELSRNGMHEEALKFFMEFQRSELEISESSLVVILAGPAAEFVVIEQIHSLAVKSGLDLGIPVGNSLLSSYCKCGGKIAEKVFWTMPVRDVVTWNAVIGGLCKAGEPARALRHLSLMGSVDGLLPNGRTVASGLRAAVEMAAPPVGESIHGKAVVLGLQDDDFVATSLVNFYARCGRIKRACYVFEEMPQRRASTWNALVGGFSRRDLAPHCIAAVREMLRSGGAVAPNEFSFASALRGSSSAVSNIGQLHSVVVKLGFNSHGRVASAAASAYAATDNSFNPAAFLPSSSHELPLPLANAVGGIWNRRGHYRETMELMSQVKDPDLISCNIFLAACVRSGDHGDALRLFKRMLAAWGLPDDYAAVSLLNICKNQCDVQLGALFHGLMIKTSFLAFDVFSHNALLDMYAKCGSMEGCRKVFEEMPTRNMVSWTAMVAALGVHGGAAEAVAAFRRMEDEGFCPDRVAFLAAMSACRHGGLVGEAMELLRRMEEGGDVPVPAAEHYACVVELLCKCGKVKDAEQIISLMPFEPGPQIWRIFLRGCADLAGPRVV